jgi:hypothetical protein
MKDQVYAGMNANRSIIKRARGDFGGNDFMEYINDRNESPVIKEGLRGK